jgi:hypothetical protein
MSLLQTLTILRIGPNVFFNFADVSPVGHGYDDAHLATADQPQQWENSVMHAGPTA